MATLSSFLDTMTGRRLPSGATKVSVVNTLPGEPRVTDIYLLGTCHVSKNSVAAVSELLESIKPQAVMVELCRARRIMLQPNRPPNMSVGQYLDGVCSGRLSTMQALISWMGGMAAEEMDSPAGEEFRVAARLAKEQGAKLVLGDRAVEVTIARAWGSLGWWSKVKMVGDIVWFSVTGMGESLNEMEEKMKDGSLSELLLELGTAYPGLMEPLVHERDRYMAGTLRKLCSEHDLIVAIVGAAHIPGIKEHLKPGADKIDLKALSRMPARPQRGRSTWIVLTAAAAAATVSVICVRSWRRAH